MSRLHTRLDEGKIILIDGGTGTELERRGVPMVDNAWCATGALTDADVVRDVHSAYIDAGAEVIITNTFATSRHVLARAGIEEHFERLNRLGVELAVQARERTGRSSVVVAGSLSTTQMGGDLPPVEVARANYAEQAAILADAGAELLVLEMIRDIEHTNAALAGAGATGLPVWLGYSCVIDDGGTPLLFDGETRLDRALAALDHSAVDVVAIMHTEVDDTDACLDVVQAGWDGPVGVWAHCGRFDPPHWQFLDVISPKTYTSRCEEWIGRGVQVIGGCCGIGPEHIAHLHEVIAPG